VKDEATFSFRIWWWWLWLICRYKTRFFFFKSTAKPCTDVVESQGPAVPALPTMSRSEPQLILRSSFYLARRDLERERSESKCETWGRRGERLI
jgi:hypothetical protein